MWKDKSYLTNLIFFYSEGPGCVAKWGAMGVPCLKASKHPWRQICETQPGQVVNKAGGNSAGLSGSKPVLMSRVRCSGQQPPPDSPPCLHQWSAGWDKQHSQQLYTACGIGEDISWIKLRALDVEKPPEQPILGCASKSSQPAGGRQVFPCVQLLWDHCCSSGPTSGLSRTREALKTWGDSDRQAPGWLGLEHTVQGERARGESLFSWKEQAWGEAWCPLELTGSCRDDGNKSLVRIRRMIGNRQNLQHWR